MIDPNCRRYLEEPEQNAGHLDTCDACRALFGPVELPSQAVDVSALPIAPWEGATHRAWPLIAAVALLLVTLAFALSSLAGTTPLVALESGVSSLESARSEIAKAGERLREAARMWQVVFGAAFVAVNVLLVRLLRRPPRGVDA